MMFQFPTKTTTNKTDKLLFSKEFSIQWFQQTTTCLELRHGLKSYTSSSLSLKHVIGSGE